MGTPIIVVQDGKLLENNIKKAKININDLLEECRGNGYFNLSEIAYAIMEVNGSLSILPKGKYKPLAINDLQLPNPSQGLCANIIIDGKVMKNNLKITMKDEKWLQTELKKQGYHNYSGILLATLDVKGNLNVFERNQHELPKNFLE